MADGPATAPGSAPAGVKVPQPGRAVERRPGRPDQWRADQVGGQRQQPGLVFGQAPTGLDAGRAVHAPIGHGVEPAPHLAVGQGDVQLQAAGLQRRQQRHQEAALQVAVEAFDLALGPGPVRPAQAQLEAAGPGASGAGPGAPS
jgi:hypothetical protein